MAAAKRPPERAYKVAISTYITMDLSRRLEKFRTSGDTALTDIVEKALVAYLKRRGA